MPGSIKAAFFDVDGVLVDKGLGMGFTLYLAERGLFPEENWEHMLKGIKDLYEGSITYQQASELLTSNWTCGLIGKNKADMEKRAEKFIQTAYQDICPETEPLIRLFKTHGYYTIAVSVSPIEVLTPFAAKIGIEEVYGTTVRTDASGTYVRGTDIKLDSEHGKSELVGRIVEEKNINLKESYALGDTMHDASMLQMIEHPIVVKPKDQLAQLAEQNGWKTYQNLREVLEDLERELS